MHGELLGEKVIVAKVEAESVELKGYGRKEGKGAKEEWEGRVTLSLEEAAVLLEAGKIVITREKEKGAALTLEEFFQHAMEIVPNFGARYLTYKDLKERGYVVHPGGVDFWLYPRGAKPGEKPARYFVRILSERALLAVKDLEELLVLAHNMRKEPIIAVVDDESDVTYYEVKEAKFEGVEPRSEQDEGKREKRGKSTVFVLGDKVVVRNADLAETLFKNRFYGRLTKENSLLLSLVEAAYLIKKGQLALKFERFVEYASSVEADFLTKYAVYEDLREKGLIIKTGFKFGSHFRVYKTINKKHSTDLIHVLPGEHVFSMPELARAVRLAHGVKKRMIFVYQTSEKTVNKPAAHAAHPSSRKGAPLIRYVDIGRMKL